MPNDVEKIVTERPPKALTLLNPKQITIASWSGKGARGANATAETRTTKR